MVPQFNTQYATDGWVVSLVHYTLLENKHANSGYIVLEIV